MRNLWRSMPQPWRRARPPTRMSTAWRRASSHFSLAGAEIRLLFGLAGRVEADLRLLTVLHSFDLVVGFAVLDAFHGGESVGRAEVLYRGVADGFGQLGKCDRH